MPGGGNTVYQGGYPGAYPPQGRGGIMYPPQAMPGMPPRPRYAPTGQMPPMGMPAPYAPQGYPNATYPSGPGAMPGPGGVRGAPPAGPAGRGTPMPSMNGRGSLPPSGPAGMRAAPAGTVPPRSGPYPPGPVAPTAARPQARASESQASGINPGALAKASPAEQKQMLGEALYPQIAEKQPEKAGKITGMLLECDNSELLYLVEDPVALSAKIQEALTVLEEYERSMVGQQA